jgi:hypothetical protein
MVESDRMGPATGGTVPEGMEGSAPYPAGAADSWAARESGQAD